MNTKRGLDSQIIFNAAAELAEEKGLENVSLLQVAEKLGVRSPSLYNHLSGLQELSSGIAEIAISRLEDAVRNAAVGRSKEDALTAIAGAYRKFAKENPELYKAILRFPTYNDSGVKEAGHALVRILYQVMKPYHYSKEETIDFVRGFRSALHGFVSLEEAGFFQSADANVNKSYERLVSRLISTLDTKGEI
ncbi:MAG: TetR/AcrR family transcriptional regulator [Candidatus Methanomethylophilus sp.]|nr:TetR/AcrR family transcriptional regulator [Methanomethylophilus sp.]